MQRLQLINFFAGDSLPQPQPQPPATATAMVMNFDSSPSVSDCESGVTGNSSSSTSSADSFRRKMFDDAVAVEVSENERAYEVISRRFLSAMVENTEVVAIHRRVWLGDDLRGRARVSSFQAHAKALGSENGNGSGPNDKFGWFGSSFERINQILVRGFCYLDQDKLNNGVISLSSDHSPSQSVEKSIPDDEGIRHVLLCRVLLGKSELIKDPSSEQAEPSSYEFDSQVDDLENPTKYVIPSSNMNSHILPEYVVSFTTPSMPGKTSRMQKGVKAPTSPWISFPALISVLAKFLNSEAVCLISKYHKQYKERKITRAELIKIVRQIAGDKLLITVIKSCKGAKELKMPFGFLRNRNTNN